MSSGYPYTLQYNMQSVHHWQLLARQVIETQVAPPTETRNFANAPPTPKSAYIDNSDRTDFGKAFYGYLTTELVQKGITPVSDPSADAVIKWGTQLVWNNKNDSFPGIILGAFELVRGTLFGISTAKPNTTIEVILTTQVEKMGRISRDSHNFYINEGDEWNFCEPGVKCVPRIVTASATNGAPNGT
jgi:hypothetical protein